MAELAARWVELRTAEGRGLERARAAGRGGRRPSGAPFGRRARAGAQAHVGRRTDRLEGGARGSSRRARSTPRSMPKLCDEHLPNTEFDIQFNEIRANEASYARGAPVAH